MTLFDSHNHLQDARLEPHLPGVLHELQACGFGAAVVNGVREGDWETVATLAKRLPWVIPSFGLHPWHIAGRSSEWLETLTSFLDRTPGAAIGEIGLDRWIEGHDLEAQTPVFSAQLALGARRNLPVTIHCLKAWGALWDILRRDPVPACGFLLHSYGGPAEMVESFARHGAYFSFSAYFLHPRKAAQRDVFRQIPLDRLLVETDAPDMSPPAELNRHPLGTPGDSKPINHPANIALAYEGLAEVRGMPVAELAGAIAENFTCLFGRRG